jgi:hypothetical protein
MAGVTAAIITGAAVVGSSYLSSKAAKSAAGTQAAAADRASAAQREMFERQVELQEPFREAGMAGQNRLMQLLGISTKPKELGADASQEEKDQYAKDLADYNALVGAKDYGRYSSAEFTPAQFMANQDPGYAFRMSEGLKALDRSAAARGGLLSGSTLKGAQRYGQDLASQEYQNAFNRYQTARTNTLNPFASLAGVAQSSANTLGTAAGQFGQQMGANIIGAGNAAAAGQVGSANAISQGVGQGLNFYQGQQYLNRLPNYNTTPQYSGYTSSPSTWDAAALNAGPQPY